MVISDVHLGSGQCHAEELLAYLSSIRPKKLIINGDLIDARRTEKSYFPPSHFKVLKKILGFAAAGTEVHYICGNHDTLMHKFSGETLGGFRVGNQLLLDLDGRKTWIFHGDIFDLLPGRTKWYPKFGTAGYSLLLRISRGICRFLEVLGKRPPSAAQRIGDPSRNPLEALENFKKTAAELATHRGCGALVCGHIHQPGKQWMETSRGECLYLNSGDWVENLTALEYNFKRWKLYRYDEDKLSPFFADEDLKGMDISDLLARVTSGKGAGEAKPSGE